MSDERENEPRVPEEPAGEPHPEGEHHHHNLIEETREVIHEVVEHVPPPVRWTVRRIVALVAISLFGLIVILVLSAILYLAHRTEWVASELALVVNQTLANRSDVQLVVSNLQGNPLGDVRIVHPLLRFRDAPDEPPILEAQEIGLRYSVWALATGGKGPIEIEVVKPVVQLTRGKDGKIRLPTWKSEDKSIAAKVRQLEFHVVVRDGRVESPALKPGISGLDSRVVVDLGTGTDIDLQHLSWKNGPWGTPLENLRAKIEGADSVKVHLIELRTPPLTLRAEAAWKSKSDVHVVRAHVERVEWKWLAKVFDNGVFDVPGEGRFDADAVNDSSGWTGAFRTALTWNGLPADGTGRFSYVKDRLAVAPLDARTPSGNVSGRFDMNGHRWVIDARAEHVDPRAWKSFGLSGWPAGDLTGAFRMSQNEHHDLDLTAALAGSTLQGWRADSARVWFHAPGATTDSFIVDFVRRGGRVHLQAGTRAWGWLGQYTAQNFRLEEWPDGAKSGLTGLLTEGHGDVVSRDNALQVTGTLAGEKSEWLGARFHTWRLDGVQGRLLPTPDLVAGVRLSDVLFLGLHFDSTRAAIRLGDSRAHLDTVSVWAADTTVRLAGDSQWGENHWEIRFDRAEMASRQFHWTAEPPVALHGDPHGVVFDRLVADDGAAHAEMRGRWALPGGAYDFDARATRLDLGRLGLPVEWRLDGKTDAHLAVHGMNGDPIWDFDARATRPGEMGHHADSLAIDLEGVKHRLEVRRLDGRIAGGEITAAGRIEGTRDAWPDTLTGDGVTRWLASAAAWQGAAHADGVALEGIDDLAIGPPLGWAGRLKADVTVAGRPSNPALDGHLEATPFVWKEFRMDKVSADASLSDQRLSVSRLEMSRAGVTSTAKGSLPLHLALGEKVVIPEAPIDATAQVQNGDLAILPAFVPQIGWSQGKFDLDARVTGTPQHPRLLGSFSVGDGSVRLAGREEMLVHVAARMHFDEARVTLDTLTAHQGKEGLVRAHGAIDLKGLGVSGYRFDLALRNFSATETGLYAAQFDGNFVVTNGPRVRGEALPQVVGDVNLHRAAILFDFANQSETQQLAASTEPLYWTYRIHLLASRNLHWQPPDGDLEFSADLTMEQTADSLLIYGDLHGERGTYYFLSNRFTVQQADLTFDNENGVNPQLNIVATTRVTPLATSGDPGSSETLPHDVTATITGRSDQPQVAFTSDPTDWDEPTILRELTIGRFVGAKTGFSAAAGSLDPFDHYLTRAINRSVSNEVSRAFGGYINEWELQRDQGGLISGTGSLVMGVGSQITPNISLHYREAISGIPGITRPYATGTTNDVGTLFQRQVEAEYRLNRFFYLTTELAQRRLGISTTSTTTGPDINVNLKARWEY